MRRSLDHLVVCRRKRRGVGRRWRNVLCAETLQDAPVRAHLSRWRGNTRTVKSVMSSDGILRRHGLRRSQVFVQGLLKVRRAESFENAGGKGPEGNIKSRVAHKGALLGPHAFIQTLHHRAQPVLIRHVSHLASRGHDPLLEHLVGILMGSVVLLLG